MTERRISFEALVELVEGDRDLVHLLLQEGLIERDEAGFCAEDVDRVLTSRTLVRELEVNSAGVEIILRLREELAVARRRLTKMKADQDE